VRAEGALRPAGRVLATYFAHEGDQQELRIFHLRSAIRFLPAMPADANFLDQQENHTILSPNNGYIFLETEYRRMQ
jgi:hypothetical protein